MSYTALRNSLLAARDRRQGLLDNLFPSSYPTTLMLSLNLPGEHKTGERAERLFAWGEQGMTGALAAVVTGRGSDALGPFALYCSSLGPREAKRLAVALESGHPSGRLLDLDVFNAQGHPVDRASLGLPPRTCLLCPEAALACIRAGRHSGAELHAQVQRLIDAL
jgi:holo-ACP synthase